MAVAHFLLTGFSSLGAEDKNSFLFPSRSRQRCQPYSWWADTTTKPRSRKRYSHFFSSSYCGFDTMWNWIYDATNTICSHVSCLSSALSLFLSTRAKFPLNYIEEIWMYTKLWVQSRILFQKNWRQKWEKQMVERIYPYVNKWRKLNQGSSLLQVFYSTLFHHYFKHILKIWFFFKSNICYSAVSRNNKNESYTTKPYQRLFQTATIKRLKLLKKM